MPVAGHPLPNSALTTLLLMRKYQMARCTPGAEGAGYTVCVCVWGGGGELRRWKGWRRKGGGGGGGGRRECWEGEGLLFCSGHSRGVPLCVCCSVCH